MNKIILTLLITVNCSSIFAQSTLRAVIKDEESKEVLPFATIGIEGTNTGNTADSLGRIVIKNIPNGKQTIIVSLVGYKTKKKNIKFPIINNTELTIYLEKGELLDEVIVVSTRNYSRIENIPTRIEVLGNDEVVEEIGINPGNISKLLGETSGINVQHTSAVSGNVSFRIQGLPGKYTQLLKDGFPTLSGFASGLSLLQIPPLDLQQVEIIKGSSSTLYGGNAVAGIVNLISKIPNEKQEFSVLINQTSREGQDLSSFYSGRKGKIGFTLLTGFNTQNAKDISENNFTDIPKYDRAVVNPKLFYTPNKNNTIVAEISSSYENRLGGDIFAINNLFDTAHLFYENNETKFLTGNIKYEHKTQSENILTVKANISDYNRNLKTNTNYFSGNQISSFSEISYLLHTKKHNLVSGTNFYFDNFNQINTTSSLLLSYINQTIGIFSQDNWKINKSLSLETGLRYDYNLNFGGFILPRLAILYNINKKLSTRLSGGFGYKLPTPFTDEAERTRYQNVNFNNNLKPEKSEGANIDFTFKTPLFDELFLSVNQAFFAVQIQNPIIAEPELLKNQTVLYKNANGNLFNKGATTNIRLSIDELILYIDYTYLDAIKNYNNNNPLELTPQNRLTATLAYEDEEEGWKIGLEAFYIGNQYIENDKKTPGYWLLGASAQKRIGHLTLAINFENILNIRQTKYKSIISGNINNPVFDELYAPLDGLVGNIVLKFDLF